MELISTAIVATGASKDLHNRRGLTSLAVSVTAAVTSTVEIQGSFGKNAAGTALAWHTLTTLTDTDECTGPWYPHMRANVTAAGGQVDVHITGN